MRIIYWGNGPRGVTCLAALRAAGIAIDSVVAHPAAKGAANPMAAAAAEAGLACATPEDPNAPEFRAALARRGADLFVLGGYGKIFKPELIAIPKVMAINTHGGRLPGMRGSSPMNWALLRGETTFTLSIIRVAAGVDAGDVLLERTFDIRPTDTIAQLHETANRAFPEMLVEVVRRIERGERTGRVQDEDAAAYYPLRFPDDGLILWDQATAEQAHNQIRALTDPYPGAFTFWGGRRIQLLASERTRTPFYGEPGRVYRVTPRGVLVCAADRSLWITRARYAQGEGHPLAEIPRYARLATVREAALRWYESGAGR